MQKNRYKIKTPTGFKNFSGIVKKHTTKLYTFTFDDESYIKCSDGHAFLTDEGFKRADTITIKNTLTNKKIKEITIENGLFEVYDPVDVEEHNTYISNDIISHNTAFLGSSATLINPTDIGRITTIEPIRISSDTYLKTFKEPIDNHTYAMTVDVSEGVGGDYIAVTVTDITSMPYEVVSTYRNNKLDPLMLPDILNVLGRYYNFAHILVETNGIGKQVVNQLFYDLEYENLISSLYNKDNQITQGKQAELGVKTTKSTKRLGMTALKSLVESKQLILNDYQFKYELSRFIKKKDSYAAEDGETDDMVMSVVLLAWLTLQNYFTDLTDIDTKRKIRENALEELQSHVNMFIPIESNENHVYLNTNGEHINMTHFTTITSFEDWLNE